MCLSACFRHFSSTCKLHNVPKLNHFFPLRRRRWAFWGSACPTFAELGPAGPSARPSILPQLCGPGPSPSFPYGKGSGCQRHCSGISPAFWYPLHPPRCLREPQPCTGDRPAPSMGQASPYTHTGMQEMLPIGTGTCRRGPPRNAPRCVWVEGHSSPSWAPVLAPNSSWP